MLRRAVIVITTVAVSLAVSVVPALANLEWGT
jgi:hypothetical protein